MATLSPRTKSLLVVMVWWISSSNCSKKHSLQILLPCERRAQACVFFIQACVCERARGVTKKKSAKYFAQRQRRGAHTKLSFGCEVGCEHTVRGRLSCGLRVKHHSQTLPATAPTLLLLPLLLVAAGEGDSVVEAAPAALEDEDDDDEDAVGTADAVVGGKGAGPMLPAPLLHSPLQLLRQPQSPVDISSDAQVRGGRRKKQRVEGRIPSKT